MAAQFRKAMDALYLVCVWIAGTALVLISAVIPWAVFTRYVLNSAASWPEPTAVLLTIVLTFFGAAACYRLGLHMNVSFFVGHAAAALAPLVQIFSSRLLVGTMALFMVIYGARLVAGDLAQHDRRVPGTVGRRDLSADSARRRDPAAVRHRAPDHRCAGRGIRRACPTAGHETCSKGRYRWTLPFFL